MSSWGEACLESEISESCLSGVKARHSVNATTWRRRRSTKEEAVHRCAIERCSRAKEKLTEIHGPSGDIAADQVRIPTLERNRRRDRSGENAIAEAWSKTLNLTFDSFEAI